MKKARFSPSARGPQEKKVWPWDFRSRFQYCSDSDEFETRCELLQAIGALRVRRVCTTSHSALIRAMSENSVMEAVRSFSRPILLTEITECTKLSDEEVTRSVSLLCKDQKLCTKSLTKSLYIVWENKSVESSRTFINVTPQKMFKKSFNSPTPLSSGEEQKDIIADVEAAKVKLCNLECQLEVYSEKDKRLQLYIRKLHEYNEIKDTAIVLIGKLAEVESLTITDLYEAFGLQIED